MERIEYDLENAVLLERSDVPNSKRHAVISLFSGAGGLDLGFEQAGFSISVAVESDPACCETLSANRPKVPVVNKPIQDVSSEEILNKGSLKVLEADLVIGGPPCQPFSLAGKRQGLQDERGQLVFEFARVVKETLPKAFVLENVKGLTNWNKGEALTELIAYLEEPVTWNGVEYRYSVATPQVLDAANYGVPQHRERLFIVGNRIGKSFSYPEPTTPDHLTVNDAIGNLPPADPPSKVAKRVAKTIAGRRQRHGF